MVSEHSILRAPDKVAEVLGRSLEPRLCHFMARASPRTPESVYLTVKWKHSLVHQVGLPRTLLGLAYLSYAAGPHHLTI